MDGLNKLLAASKAASGNMDTTSRESVKPTITKDSPREEILDYIMLFICERIDIKIPVFKGGYVLTKLIPDVARATEDIDFSISEARQYEDLKMVLDDLGKNLMQLDIIDSYEIKPTIGERSSGGITMNMPTNKNLKIDIGWHDLSYGVTNWKWEGFECNRFEIERMLADKISAIFSRKRFRRTKDIYDFYVLTNNFDVSMKKLIEYINSRGLIDWNADPFRVEVVEQYAIAYDKLIVTTIEGEEIKKPELNNILSRLKEFVDNYDELKVWKHVSREFEEV